MHKKWWAVATAMIMMAASAAPVAANDHKDRGPQNTGVVKDAGVTVPPGYFLEPLTTGLNFPTGIALGPDTVWVSEAGVGGPVPTVKEINRNGAVTTILTPADVGGGRLVGPFIDVTYHDGWIWLSHRQRGVNDWLVGAISKFRPDDPTATFTTVLTNLPTAGDHQTNEVAFDAAGRAYFGQGTATNSAVVGLDNLFITGWLDRFPEFHDFPAMDVVLSGVDYTTANPLTSDPDDTAVTAPFRPFGSGPVDEGMVVEGVPRDGIIAGNGTAYSFDPAAPDPAATLRLEAWGLRNPFGVGIDPYNPGTLFVANNGADIRTKFSGDRIDGGEIAPTETEVVGSRPIANDFDDIFTVPVGGDAEFFGWPDYFHDPATGEVLPITDPLFCEDEQLQPGCSHEFTLEEGFRSGLDVLPAFSQLAVHSSANKFDFSTTKRFRHQGDLFVAETGAFVPITGADRFTGYKVVRVDRETGEASDFIVNEGNTVEEVFDPSSFNKPIDVKFAGDVMLIVDFGVFEPGLGLVQPGTGKVWLVSHGRGALRHFADGR